MCNVYVFFYGKFRLGPIFFSPLRLLLWSARQVGPCTKEVSVKLRWGRGRVYGSEVYGFQNVAFCLALKTALGAGKSRLEMGRCGKVGVVVCAEK